MREGENNWSAKDRKQFRRMKKPMPETETPKTKEACEAAGGTWDEENQTCILPPKPEAGDRDLLRKINMLEIQLKNREDQLRQAIEIANRANDERKAREEAEKQKLITSIMMDGKFNKDELEDKTLAELQTMRITLDHSIQKTFANIAADIAEQRKNRKPSLTAGAWDKEKKQWVGGI
jgi:preprotein translocase subunit SecD